MNNKTKDKDIFVKVPNELFFKLLIYSNVSKRSIPDIINDLINQEFDSMDFNQIISNNSNLDWFDLFMDLERGYYG